MADESPIYDQLLRFTLAVIAAAETAATLVDVLDASASPEADGEPDCTFPNDA